MAENSVNPRHVKIVSNGVGYQSKVYVDGELLLNVESVTWTCDGGGLATATMRLLGVEVDLTIEATDTSSAALDQAIADSDEYLQHPNYDTAVVGTAVRL